MRLPPPSVVFPPQCRACSQGTPTTDYHSAVRVLDARGGLGSVAPGIFLRHVGTLITDEDTHSATKCHPLFQGRKLMRDKETETA